MRRDPKFRAIAMALAIASALACVLVGIAIGSSSDPLAIIVASVVASSILTGASWGKPPAVRLIPGAATAASFALALFSLSVRYGLLPEICSASATVLLVIAMGALTYKYGGVGASTPRPGAMLRSDVLTWRLMFLSFGSSIVLGAMLVLALVAPGWVASPEIRLASIAFPGCLLAAALPLALPAWDGVRGLALASSLLLALAAAGLMAVSNSVTLLSVGAAGVVSLGVAATVWSSRVPVATVPPEPVTRMPILRWVVLFSSGWTLLIVGVLLYWVVA